MFVKVLKPFPYAHDGREIRALEKDAIENIDEGVIVGLQEEGFIGEATEDEIAAARSAQAGEVVVLGPPPEIPADWRELHWFKLKALAEKVSGAPVADKKAALAILEAAAA